MNPTTRYVQSIVPFSISVSSAINAQKLGTSPKTHRTIESVKKATSGRKNTVPPSLKMAKACTLFVAKVATSSVAKGVKNANKTALGI